MVDCLVLDEETELTENPDSEYSEKNFDIIKKSVVKYIDEFKRTSSYMKLKHHEKDESDYIINAFSEMMYNYFLLTPENWNARRAIKCCINLMPRKIMSGREFFTAIEPVLKAFLNFCADRDYVPDGVTISRRLEDISPAILDASENDETWGPGKALLKAAEEEGVDISDNESMQKYIDNYNSNIQTLETGKGPKEPQRNEPCPCGSGKKFKKCCAS